VPFRKHVISYFFTCFLLLTIQWAVGHLVRRTAHVLCVMYSNVVSALVNIPVIVCGNTWIKLLFVPASTYATLGASAQYNMRTALWPGDWNAVGGSADTAAAAAQSSAAAMSQCRQPTSEIIPPGREPYADMLAIHGNSSSGGQTTAEFGDLASMFTGFIE